MKCKRCGYEGHNAEECEHPFPQGHAAQQRRDEEWSYLANQVVGAETPMPTKSANGAGEPPATKTHEQH